MKNKPIRVGIVVPHIFMQQTVLSDVIFSPGHLALSLAEGLNKIGAQTTLFTPGTVTTSCTNVTADLSYFEKELKLRNDTYLDLLKKHPLTFITLARQVQSELLAKAFQMANQDQLDVVHIYTNEEDTALPFAQFCTKPVVFTHHDPFNFLVTYKNNFPKYKHLNWIALSEAQKKGMPDDTNWLSTIYHGLDPQTYLPNFKKPKPGYVAFLGRIIESKGVHIAIQAVKEYNQINPENPLILKIAGKHYAGASKDSYWQKQIKPHIDGTTIQYVGYLKSVQEKQEFLGNAQALLMPSTFEEPFGMVMIESLACGTPVIGLNSGAIPEIVNSQVVGFVPTQPAIDTGEAKQSSQITSQYIQYLVHGLEKIPTFDRLACRKHFESNFTSEKMCQKYLSVYQQLHKQAEAE